MSRRLNHLDCKFKVMAFELLARTVEAGIPVKIISTKRTHREQSKLIAEGRSWTKNSRHLTGNAIDIVPLEVLDKKDWDPGNPVWEKLGAIGERVGLRWGGRWKQRDMGHFES